MQLKPLIVTALSLALIACGSGSEPSVVELPDYEQPDIILPGDEQPDTETPIVDIPVVEIPDTELPDDETPDTDIPVVDIPDVDLPGTGTPDTDTPVVEVPDTDEPVTEVPDTEAPIVDVPDIEEPVEPQEPVSRTVTLQGQVASAASNIGISVYSFSSGVQGTLIALEQTDYEGLYTSNLNVNTENNALLVCATSGRYKESATGGSIAFTSNRQLCAIESLNETATTLTVNITPWTHYVFGYSQSLIARGVEMNNSIATAQYMVSSIYGFDPSVIPDDLAANNSDSVLATEESKMGVLVSGISQFTLAQAKSRGYGAHVAEFSSLAFHQAAFLDLFKDGMLDGQGVTSVNGETVTIGMGDTEFGRSTYTSDISSSAMEFLNSPYNHSDLSALDILEEQTAIANVVSDLLDPLSEPFSFDKADPVIVLNITNDQVISGVYNIELSASDDLGVISVSLVMPAPYTTQSVNGSAVSLSFDPSIAGAPDVEIKAVAVDYVGKVTEQVVTVLLETDFMQPSLASDTSVNSTIYTFNAVYDTEASVTPDSVTVNEELLSIAGGSIFGTVTLSEGQNTLDMVLVDTYGFEHNFSYEVYVDSESPELIIVDNNDDSNYKTYFKEVMVAEPVLSKLTFNADQDPIYIDTAHLSLNSMAVTAANLAGDDWAFITVTGHDALTSKPDLTFEYSYYQDDVPKKTQALSNTGSDLIIPIAEEYLTAAWYEFSGDHMIKVTVTDALGNASSHEFSFTVHKSVPQLTTETNISSYVSGIHNTIVFESSDFTGVDRVVLIVDGVEYESISVTDPSFTIDSSGLFNGNNFGTIKAYKDGVEIYTDRVDFKVDNSYAEIEVTSSLITNQTSLNVLGTAINNNSGVEYVNVNGSDANYQLFGNSFSKTVSGLTEGINSVIVTAASIGGVVKDKIVNIIVDMTAPLIETTYPKIGNPYQVAYKVTGNKEPTNATFVLNQFTSPIYVDQYHESMSGVSLTEVALSAAGYSFIKFIPTDPASGTFNDVFTESSLLFVSYKYKQGSTVSNQGDLNITNAGEGSYIIPLSDEYLAANWESYNGTHSIEVTTTDLASNSSVEVFQFSTYKAVPSADFDQVDLWLNGTSVTASFTTTDFTGFDKATLTIGGQTYESNNALDAQFTINSNLLSTGAKPATLVAYKNNGAGYSQAVVINIDNSEPETTITSQAIIKSNNYTITGTAIDGDSDVKEVRVNGVTASYDTVTDTFSHALEYMAEGVHTVAVESENYAGIVNSTSIDVFVDKTLGYFGTTYPNGIYNVKYLHVVSGTVIQSTFELDSTNSCLYMVPENTVLGSTPLSESALESSGYLFTKFFVRDNPSNFSQTSMEDMKVTYDYRVNNVLIFGKKELNVNGVNGVYHYLPMTTEYLGANFFSTGSDEDLHKIRIYLNDKAGNEVIKYFYFRACYDAGSTQW